MLCPPLPPRYVLSSFIILNGMGLILLLTSFSTRYRSPAEAP